jgi:ribosomal protein S18 acetylase RimI-like enzyme
VSDEFANFITKQFAPERLRQAISAHPGRIIVAEYENNLVGVAEIHPEKKAPAGNITAPELSKLYILEWFCGKHIGQQLLIEAERFAIALGAAQLWLWVLISNERAVSFYKKHGFKTIGTAFFQMEVNRYENLVMVKALGSGD